MTKLAIRAAAKLNLGLEVVGRRPDGFHEVVTILQAVSISDAITVRSAADLVVAASDPALGGDGNLALTALRRLREHAGGESGAEVWIDKGIPVAAGLGGASSDAAATLLAGRRLWEADASDDALADIAVGLGSDVPFFLRGGTALATGRGERLEPLPTVAAWFVVVAPRVIIPRKTAILYAALTEVDFTTGGRVRAQADRLRAGQDIDPTLLVNAFEAPLFRLRPDLARVGDTLRRAGAPVVALSGAGPSRYAVVADAAAAVALATTVRAELGGTADVFVCRAENKPPVVRRA